MKLLQRSDATFWEVTMYLLRIYKNLNFSLGAFRDLGLEILEKAKKHFPRIFPKNGIPHNYWHGWSCLANQ